MKNLKRALAMFMALLLVVSLAACTSEEPAEETSSMDLTESKSDDTAKTDSEDEVAAEVSIETLAADYFANKPDHSYLMDQKEMVAKVAAGDDMFILDIRQPDAYAEGHLKGAVNAPWGSAIAENLNKIPQDKEVFIYCYSGQTAGQAVMTLNAAGINARSVKYGWNFGISKVDGVADVTETTANDFGSETYEVAANVQAELDAYYTGLADVADSKFKNYKVSEDNLKAMIAEGEDFFLLSARKADDYAEAHIEGAVNIPYGKSFIDGIANVPKDKPVVVYCYSGQTAGQATAAMRLMGYNAVSLNGGMGTGANAPIGWMNKGYTVVSSSAVYNGVVDYFANKPDHSYLIAEADIIAKVAAEEDIFVLDIRQAKDYEAGHLKGAVNAPWGPAIAESLNKIPQDKEVFIYCYSGQTAGQAVMGLNLAGINARSVKYGWSKGLSLTEGIEDVTETTVNEFGTDTYTVDAEIQEAITAYYAAFADAPDKFKSNIVSEDNLATMIEMDEDFFLISARKPDDYAAGHIQGAVNIPYGKTFIEGLGGVPKDKPVVVYCYSGQTAGQATAAMRFLGYNAVSLKGGASTGKTVGYGWAEKGYEFVTD